ncbi:hypothetical protein QYE76_007803 [Lolium multiflorum]|uniref:SMAX1-like nucleotide binding domain-containing protein n=1 Tax=Lolium multiflorum TaxID=4521 RepID=A0AAD8V746_LOLMU|nr:hypothetical protein QYE76_007803 [Lolium multiflorum]
MNPRWHPDNQHTWDAFFINRRERALARYEEDGLPPGNFHEAGRRLWWYGRTLQSVMDYITAGDIPRLRYPQFEPRAPPDDSDDSNDATTTPQLRRRRLPEYDLVTPNFMQEYDLVTPNFMYHQCYLESIESFENGHQTHHGFAATPCISNGPTKIINGIITCLFFTFPFTFPFTFSILHETKRRRHAVADDRVGTGGALAAQRQERRAGGSQVRSRRDRNQRSGEWGAAEPETPSPLCASARPVLAPTDLSRCGRATDRRRADLAGDARGTGLRRADMAGGARETGRWRGPGQRREGNQAGDACARNQPAVHEDDHGWNYGRSTSNAVEEGDRGCRDPASRSVVPRATTSRFVTVDAGGEQRVPAEPRPARTPTSVPSADASVDGASPSVPIDRSTVRAVLEVMVQKQGRNSNSLVVGDLVSMVEAVAGELPRRLERGEVPEKLAGAHLLKLEFSYVHVHLMNRADVVVKAAELRRSVDAVLVQASSTPA